MPPTDSDPTPPSAFWPSLLPDPVSRVVAIVLAILVTLFCILRFVLPSPRITSMSKAFDDMKKLYDKARDAHMFNSQLETESVPNEFIAIDDRARDLVIKTLDLSLSTHPALWWWGELRYGFSIMKCTWDIGILKQKIQLIIERRTNDLNMTPTVGLTSAQQVWLRRQRTLDSEA
ncbi:hypothetical protein DFH08DRAFT_943450 [Mycena albidolilacea]|uniref:Uncharacterized protein n=1 Tax=Mycena albidolilacea TaxID=1033008 RepID=A0AAD7ECV3_9AGAR|nr:hypothetical protein DFH08DRAFT_943450 [Mycena albidolilacea]